MWNPDLSRMNAQSKGQRQLRFRGYLSVAAISAVIGMWFPVAGGCRASVQAAEPSIQLPQDVKAHKNPKIDSQLLEIDSTSSRSGLHAALKVADGYGLTTSGGEVRVVVTAIGHASAVRDAVEALGGRVEAEYAELVQALVPARSLRELAASPSVRYVRPPARSVAASVTDEGVAESNALAWHGAGFTGAGVKIGVIDIGFAYYDLDQDLGELPGNLTIANIGVDDLQHVTHGTAVAEVVYEMAPRRGSVSDLRGYRSGPRNGQGLRHRSRDHDHQPLGGLVEHRSR